MQKIIALYDDLLGPAAPRAKIMTTSPVEDVEIRVHDRRGLEDHLGRWETFVTAAGERCR